MSTPITLPVIAKIRQIIRYFETSKISGANYGALAILPDGPMNRRQITYGASQTTEYGNLKNLLQMYVNAKGQYGPDLNTFLIYVGATSRPSLCDNKTFIDLLKKAAQDPVMQQTQDRFFMIYYFNPARQWFERNDFTLALSLLVIYDSFTHSGSIMQFLRNRFAEKVPAAGGDERAWIKAYVMERDHWLETHKTRPILRGTDYRTDSFIHAMRQDNWNLDKPFEVVNYKDPLETGKPRIMATIV